MSHGLNCRKSTMQDQRLELACFGNGSNDYGDIRDCVEGPDEKIIKFVALGCRSSKQNGIFNFEDGEPMTSTREDPR
jgi:hypothetical protein